MAHYKTFWDLASSQAYTTHTVESFDANTSTGGGTFRWILANNSSITNIAGFRIKPTSTTLGYWERVVDGDGWSVDWFGCVNTSGQALLSTYYSQAQLDTMYSNGSNSNTITTTDTYDTAAIKFAFNCMERGLTFRVNFSKTRYFLTSTCYLPLRASSTSVKEYELYDIYGNGAQIEPHSTKASTAFDYFSRNITSLSQAKTEVNTTLSILDLAFQGGPTRAQKCIHLKATYNSLISRCFFTNLADGLHLRFCMGTLVYLCMANKITGRAVNVDCGDSSIYSGGFGGSYGSSNSQSNSTEIYKFRFWSDTPTAVGIEVNGCSGVEINQPILEGISSGTAMAYGIHMHARSSGNVKDFTVSRCHLECVYGTAAIRLDLDGGGKATITGIYSQYNNTVISAADDSSNGKVTVSNIEYVTAASKFEDTSGGSLFWYFDRSMSINPLDPTRWVGGSVPGSANTSYIVAQASTNRVHYYQPFGSSS